LFGKVNILDLGAIAVIILVLIGIFVVPGPSGSVAQVGNKAEDTIEINVLVRGLSLRNPEIAINDLSQQEAVNVIVIILVVLKMKISSKNIHDNSCYKQHTNRICLGIQSLPEKFIHNNS